MSLVWATSHPSLCIMCLTCPWFDLCYTTHCALCVSQHVLCSSFVTPLTVHYVSHSMPLVWGLLHHTLCIMCLTACPLFEFCYTTHCASCVSQYVLGLSYVAPLTVHHLSHSMSLVWALLRQSLLIMYLLACPKYFFLTFLHLGQDHKKITAFPQMLHFQLKYEGCFFSTSDGL